ncbi:MAG: helix-turn-helix domain-containing protein [Bacteroidales bacterium]|nr:helix-turn-helix domain-containing protein [Bacteroidales bacterium]
MKELKFYTLDEIKDKHIGKIGTPERDEYEAELQSYLIGEAIKRAREAKQLTQEQLGELMGVQKAQVSKIESGRNLTFATIRRAFKAMNINATLDMGQYGTVVLW